MTEIQPIEKNDLKHKYILIKNIWFVFFCYNLGISILHLGIFLGASQLQHSDLLVFYYMVYLPYAGILTVTWLKPQISKRYTRNLFIAQFILWIASFSLWDFYLQALRPTALISAFICVTYLFLYTRLSLSIAATFAIATIHLLNSYLGINHFGHQDNLTQEIVYTMTFIGSGCFVAWKTGFVRDKIRRAASTDGLTRLMNRRVFIKKLHDAFDVTARYKHENSLLMLDIDHFKQVNDQFGHKAGDDVLVFLAKFLKTSLRKTDYVCRWGGEEFLILFSHTPLNVAEKISNRLLSEFSCQYITTATQPIRVGFSAGLTLLSTHSSAEEAIQEADKLLYEAKEQGRKRIITSKL